MHTPQLRPRPLLALSLAALSLWGLGCAHTQSGIAGGPDAEAVLAVLERYRAAMEGRDVDGVLAVVSADYLEDMGTPSAGDDLSRGQLEARLRRDFADTLTVRLDLEVLRLEFDEPGEVATLDYRYDLRLLVRTPSADKWHNKVDINRMTLHREGDSWRVVTGL